MTAVRLTVEGTHTGEGMGIPPTGRRVSIGAIVMCRWQDGRIAEAWNEYDALGMMQQLGAGRGGAGDPGGPAPGGGAALPGPKVKL